ncbi:ABC transporter substrate-binding protein [Vibrio nigripulchritudo]|uniref:ABC transporter substrate-binding protein n=1 Tax=Vibrio nigripulchritudo TaxID=28173 RepID=UPI0003B1C66B|nr:sugar ABC transporter substrate-binding protein [Vibrio nigripulchritudo]CCN73642.1 Sugar binding protein [Vibrio nigripulchritudo SFn118]
MKGKFISCLLGSVIATSAFADDGTLNVWARYGNNEIYTVGRLMTAFTDKTGIQVELFTEINDFETRLARATAGRKLPDIVLNDSGAMGQMKEMGILLPVDRSAIKGGEDVLESAWRSMQANDKNYYGVPFSAQAFALFIRKDWREKLGYDVPKNWEELYELAKAFTEKDPDGNGKNDTYGYIMALSTTRGYTSWSLSDFIWQAGGQFMEKTATGFKSSLATPETEKAMTYARKIICDGYAQPSAITSTTTDAAPSFITGQAGMYRTGPYMINHFNSKPGKGVFEVVLPPAGPAGGQSLAEGSSVYMLKGGNTDAAKKFVEFIISEEGQRIGMSEGVKPVTGYSNIVRNSVNKNISTTSVYNDPSWDLFSEQLATDGVYFPSVPNWVPFRRITAEGFNKIMSSCSSDVMGILKDLDKEVNAELARQDVLAK